MRPLLARSFSRDKTFYVEDTTFSQIILAGQVLCDVEPAAAAATEPPGEAAGGQAHGRHLFHL